MTNNEHIAQLEWNLYKPFLFYIPFDVIPNDYREPLKNPETFKIFNQFILIRADGFDELAVEKYIVLSMATKKKVLEENLLDILEQKANLKDFQFDYFLEKYIEKLNVCIVISKWLTDHVEQYMPICEKAFIGMLHYQHNEFVFHQEEINNKVKSIKKENATTNIDLFTFLKEKFPTVANQINETVKAQTTPIETLTKTQETKSTTKKKQKPILITNEEARVFLLKSVFNVNIDELEVNL